MKRFLVLLAVVALFTAPAFAAGTVVGSRHDLRVGSGGTPTATGQTEVCVSCHTPHQATLAAGQDPLWNKIGTATTAFGVYDSDTMDAVPTNIGGATMGGQSVSMLCMSCHDGTVSVISMYNPPSTGQPTTAGIALRIDGTTGAIISNANMGTSLTNDHPVNFLYDGNLVTADGGLKPPPTALLIGGMVQCSSCHDVHDPTNAPFLTMGNTNSALCLQCHNK